MTATSLSQDNDSMGITSIRVYLEAGKLYEFSCDVTPYVKIGGWSDTSVNFLLLPNGTTNNRISVQNNTFAFVPKETAIYYFRLDIHENNKTYEFSNISITEKNPETKLVVPGQTYGELPEPTRTGYEFGGWYLDSNYQNKVISSTIVSNSQDHTLYAYWKQPYTITNLVQNGSFENGISNWAYANVTLQNSISISNSYKSFGNNSFERMANTDGSGKNYISQGISFIAEHNYYIFFYGYTISTSSQFIVSDVANRVGTGMGITITNADGWVKGSIIKNNYPYTEARSFAINYATTTDYTYVDGAGIVDLTEAFGSGNEPSKEWCDANIDYFDGSTIIYK